MRNELAMVNFQRKNKTFGEWVLYIHSTYYANNTMMDKAYAKIIADRLCKSN